MSSRLTRRSFHAGLGLSLGLRPFLKAQQQPASGGERGIVLRPDAGKEIPANQTPGNQTSGQSRRLALIVGNDSYLKAPKLANARHDAADTGARLREFSFETTVLADATAAAFRTGFEKFRSTVGAGDTVFFFYAGHGVQSKGENFLIPVDFDPAGGEDQLQKTGIRATSVRGAIEASGAQLNILVLDACRDNPFRPGDSDAGMALMEPGLGACIALSTGPGRAARDNPEGRNGLFTKHLLAQLSAPGQDIDSLFHNVRNAVFKESSGSQRPWIFSDTVGDFYFSPTSPANPGSSRAKPYLDTGKVHFQAGRYEDAAASFDRALRLDPENPFTYNALGSARAGLKQWSVSIGHFGAAIDLKDDYAAAYYNRGTAYVEAGARYDLALQDFSWAVEVEPYDPRALDFRGDTFLRMRENEKALADFNKALSVDPSDSTAMAGAGRALFGLGRYDEAVRSYTSAIARRPLPGFYEDRAQAYQALRQNNSAQQDLQRADRLRSGN